MSGHPSGTGPFDSQGRYHEEWADNPPSRGHSRASQPPPVPGSSLLSSNELIRNGPQGPTKPSSPPKSKTTRHAPDPGPPPVVVVKNEPKRHAPESAPEPKSKSKRHASDTPAVAKNEPKHHASPESTGEAKHTPKREHATPDVAEATPKPKSKPKTAATKSKRSGSVRVTVKPGDSLWTLAKHYKTTESAIKKANNLSSDLIRDGKTLVIPRH